MPPDSQVSVGSQERGKEKIIIDKRSNLFRKGDICFGKSASSEYSVRILAAMLRWVGECLQSLYIARGKFAISSMMPSNGPKGRHPSAPM